VLPALVDHRERERTESHPRTRVEALLPEKTIIERYEILLLELQSIPATQER
jgi:hypothetical protein